MMDLSDLLGLLNLLPEPWRTYVRAVLFAVSCIIVVSSAITAKTPAWAFKKWRALRVFSFISTIAPKDGAGSVKLPFSDPKDPGAMEDLARLRRAVEAIGQSAAPLMRETQAPPPPREGERGTVRVSVLVSLSGAVLVATLAGALLTACPGPVTPVDGGPAVTPSSWTSTARVVITTLRWALPAVRAITDLVVAEPGRTQVARALDAAAQATDRLHGAVDAYEARGGDRCVARAAVGGLQVALVGVAQVLADNGVALGTTLERIVDAVASIADALIPACDADAGWSSAGDASNARLRAIAEGARARGVTLRRVLDDLRPMDAGAL